MTSAGAQGARLPRWLLPDGWPQPDGEPLPATLHFTPGGTRMEPDAGPALEGYLALDGALVLPPLIEPHAHLDKTFTVRRSPARQPGLLAAIDAVHQDRAHWSREDLRARIGRALDWATHAGVGLLRTHIDWSCSDAPLAWQVVGELDPALCQIERVALLPLPLFADADMAERLAAQVASDGKGAVLGGFIHSSNWDAQAITHLLQAAERWHLDIDLHIDEELDPRARGMRELAQYLQREGFSGRICCSHACALSQQADAEQLLDVLAQHRVSLIALPLTNLLLQDVAVGRTPRQRGLTLIKEAQARGIPVLLGADNVQDAFCPVGSYDPLDTLFSGMLAAQLGNAFDEASALICRRDALHDASSQLANDFVIFPAADIHSWPLRQHQRYRLVDGTRHVLACGA